MTFHNNYQNKNPYKNFYMYLGNFLDTHLYMCSYRSCHTHSSMLYNNRLHNYNDIPSEHFLLHL